jgi:hypothetical protein
MGAERKSKEEKVAKTQIVELNGVATQKTASKVQKTPGTVEEPAVAYTLNVWQENNFVILHEASKKPESRMTSFEKIGLIREGISKKDLEHLKEKAELDYNQLAKVLSVARATLINKKGKEKFDMVLSEKIMGVADIYSYG